MTDVRARHDLIDALLRVERLGLNRALAGNVSLRLDAETFLISPSGMAPAVLTPGDIVRVGLDGEAEGRRKPSSEWRLHRDIYASRPEAGAVVHAHSLFATVIACKGLAVPPFHYMIAIAGGDDIRCVPYVDFGTQAVSDVALEALQDRSACLLAHHGQVALGRNLDEAITRATQVEELCQQFWHLLALGGEMRLLARPHVDYALRAFSGYGHNAQGEAEG